MPQSNCVVLSLTSTIRTDTWDFGRQALQILYDADDRLRRDEPRGKIAVRECQYDVLSSDRFFHTLDKKAVFLN